MSTDTLDAERSDENGAPIDDVGERLRTVPAMFDFNGKTVLITGASYGLGEGFAHGLRRRRRRPRPDGALGASCSSGVAAALPRARLDRDGRPR